MFGFFKNTATIKAQAAQIDELKQQVAFLDRLTSETVAFGNELKSNVDALERNDDRIDSIESQFEDLKREWENYSDDLKNEYEREMERQLEYAMGDVKDEYESAIESAVDDLKDNWQSDFESLKETVEEQLAEADMNTTRIEELLAKLVSKQMTVRKKLPGASIRIQGI